MKPKFAPLSILKMGKSEEIFEAYCIDIPCPNKCGTGSCGGGDLCKYPIDTIFRLCCPGCGHIWKWSKEKGSEEITNDIISESFSKMYDDLLKGHEILLGKHMLLKINIKKITIKIEAEILKNPKKPNLGKKGCLNRLNQLLKDIKEITKRY